MSAALEGLGRDKALLLARSRLCRLQLRRDAQALRDSLHWKRSLIAAASAPATGRIALGLALSFAGLGRAARVVALVGRIALVAKLACSVIGFARKLATPASEAGEDRSVR
jgi:hypothetical protein